MTSEGLPGTNTGPTSIISLHPQSTKSTLQMITYISLYILHFMYILLHLFQNFSWSDTYFLYTHQSKLIFVHSANSPCHILKLHGHFQKSIEKKNDTWQYWSPMLQLLDHSTLFGWIWHHMFTILSQHSRLLSVQSSNILFPGDLCAELPTIPIVRESSLFLVLFPPFLF